VAEPTSIRIELVAYSQFAATPAYQVVADVDGSEQNVAVFGLKRNLVVPDPTDIIFTVPAGGTGRLDLISQKFYAVPDLWWAVAQCNPEMDPMIGPNAGDLISVPTKLRLAALGILNV
jgi:hypothetical protein